MPLVCPHCSRANRADARFCHFDGVSLNGSVHAPADAAQAFPTPFVFPSGLACKNYDDFANGCLAHWDAAVEMLQRGMMHSFFGALGRHDLAHAAEEAANFPDRERGLDRFLDRLPTQTLPTPKIEVTPKLITLGPLKVGDHGKIDVTLLNRGQRLIFGSISSSCQWLTASETGDARHFQFRQSSTLAVQIKGQHLRAGKPLEGTLLLETNAGAFKLKVIAEVPIVPFAEGVLAGARSPRALAEKAKASPKQAVPLFESGAVLRWYQANGWTYPVQGPTATGMAAVQQFFEALGLSKPPKVHVSWGKIPILPDSDGQDRNLTPRNAPIALSGKPGAKLALSITVQGDENRPVYAHAICAAAWLAVQPSRMHGTTATLPIEITVPACAGETARTTLTIQANGKQRFDIPVEVAVALPVQSAECRVQSGKPSLHSGHSTRHSALRTLPSEEAGTNTRKLLMHVVPVALLGVVLLGLVAKDMISGTPRPQAVAIKEEPPEEKRAPAAAAEYKVAIQDEPDDVPVVPVARYKIEDEPEEQFLELPAPPVKVEIKDEPDEAAPIPGGKGAPIDPNPRVAYAYSPGKAWGLVDTVTRKRLTYATDGSTNITSIRVDGQSLPIGAGAFRNLPDEPAREARQVSSHAFSPRPGLRVTQILAIVPSKQPVDVGGQPRRLMDTLLVRYLFENIGKQPINAGLRLEVDTLIGNNDGVPFTVPGKGLVNTSADFIKAELVPDFVQALETGNLRQPGTIVHISLKVGGGIEAPARVTLCHWASNGDLSNIRTTHMGTDSAIIMAWPDQNLPPGQRREMGYAYGLGSVTVTDPGGTLGVTLGGNFDIGQSFTITAYVNKPVAGQTLTLDLPPGLDRIKGEQIQNVPAPTVGTTSIISWEAKVLQTGVFPVKVRSSTGVTQTKTITIAQASAPTGGKLTMEIAGDIEPGKVFRVIGKVNEPIDNQTLSLQLPAGLERVSGAATQRVPAGSKDALVDWQVRVLEPGKYPVRVASSTGVAQTKTITIVQPGRAEGLFQVLLTGNFTPGNVFTVSTKVINPAPNQQLTLVLPAGLQHVDGTETQVVRAGEPIAWKVRIKDVGKYLVGVKSSTGVTQRKTIVIEPPRNQGGDFTFDLVGDIKPGKEFRVIAQVAKPAPGQTLTLVLPKGLTLMDGDEVQTVAGRSEIAWTVRVTASGRLPVRIESSTGLARTKTINLTQTSGSLFGR